MAKQTLNLPAYLSNDADFRTWGKGLSDAIAAVGLVKGADSGQIDWTTVLRPAVNTYAGYEIWRFSDALQATAPVFIKIEYGVPNAQDRPALAVTAGTATNGAGTITGQLGARQALAAASSKAAGDKLGAYVAGHSGGLILCHNLDPSSGNFSAIAAIGRTHDATGVAEADGIVAYAARGSSTYYQVIPAVGSVPAVSLSGLPVPPTLGARSVVGLDVAIGVPAVLLGKVHFIDLMVTYEHADIGELAPIVLNTLGAAHTYLPLGDGGGVGHGVGTAVALAMLWE